MSRGPGRLQRAVLDSLPHDAPISVDELCWQLALRGNRCSPRWEPEEVARDLPKTFYVSFRRAVLGLARSKSIWIERRKLENIEELVRYYPNKTRFVRRKTLRERLLPRLAEYIGRSVGRFSIAENEAFLAAQVPDGAQQQWFALENTVIDVATVAAHVERERLLQVLAKGRQYFSGESGISCTLSLGSLVKDGLDAIPSSTQAAALYDELKQFYLTCFPRSVRGHARLKSQLYEVARLDESVAQPHLHDSFKLHLFEVEKGFLERLPGHRTITASPAWKWLQPNEFSPVLDELIGRDAFRVFEFIRRS